MRLNPIETMTTAHAAPVPNGLVRMDREQTSGAWRQSDEVERVMGPFDAHSAAVPLEPVQGGKAAGYTCVNTARRHALVARPLKAQALCLSNVAC